MIGAKWVLTYSLYCNLCHRQADILFVEVWLQLLNVSSKKSVRQEDKTVGMTLSRIEFAEWKIWDKNNSLPDANWLLLNDE